MSREPGVRHPHAVTVYKFEYQHMVGGNDHAKIIRPSAPLPGPSILRHDPPMIFEGMMLAADTLMKCDNMLQHCVEDAAHRLSHDCHHGVEGRTSCQGSGVTSGKATRTIRSGQSLQVCAVMFPLCTIRFLLDDVQR